MIRSLACWLGVLTAAACVNTGDTYGTSGNNNNSNSGAATRGPSGVGAVVGAAGSGSGTTTAASSSSTGGTGRSTSSTSGVATSGTTTGTSATTTSGGSTSGADPWCVVMGSGIYVYPRNDCPTDQVEIAGQIYDFVNSVNPGPEPGIEITDLLDTNLNGNYTSCGIFYFCVPSGTTVEPKITLSGYIPLVLPQVTGFADAGAFYPYTPGVYIVATTFASDDLDMLPLDPPFDISQGTVLVQASNFACDNGDPSNPSYSASTFVGWQFFLVNDAGVVFDGDAGIGVVFIEGAGTPASSNYTQADGVEVIYDIPSSIQNAWVVGYNLPAIDAGTAANCYYTGLASFDMSSYVAILPDAFTFFPYVTP